MGVSSIEDRKSTCCLSPKIYQPAEDNMDGLTEFPRKKKMFSSSSFYEEPNCIYPTVEEQVQLCRKIAESLSDDCNTKSKGANMFFKRVKKAEKWVVAESNESEQDESSNVDPAQMPYVRPSRDGPPCLKLILDPRHLVDMEWLLNQGVDIVKHDTISPEVCHDIVKDLNSPTGRGGQLFAKRKKKSEEWIVDEEKVKHLLQTRYASPELPDIDSQTVVETVIRAAEAKVMRYPNAVPHHPIIETLDGGTSQDWGQSEAYKFRAPKGWTSNNPVSSLPTVPEIPEAVTEKKTSTDLETATLSLPRFSSPLSRSMSFNNFNKTPRAWNADLFSRPGGIKPVKPPSMLIVQ